jgi:hypothetical protein
MRISLATPTGETHQRETNMTESIAGIKIPDTKLVGDATELVSTGSCTRPQVR